MLKKNVYILYPAGYHGNYVKWSIEVSDPSNTKITKNPINTTTTIQYGGVGTSHVHSRIPSHQGFFTHQIWMMYNQPQDRRIYLINTVDPKADISRNVATLLLQDPTGIVINLHDDDDEDFAAYGKINCITKWPTFIPAWQAALTTKEVFHDGFDPFNCSRDREFRNHIVKHNFLGSCGKPNIDLIEKELDLYHDWFLVRNEYQPHEVNYDTYPRRPDISQRFFDISLREILSPEFPEKIKSLTERTGLFDKVDTSPIAAIHSEYVGIQPNLPWFDSIKQWKKTQRLDDYLLSHSVIEAELISRIMADSHIAFFSKDQLVSWAVGYNLIKDPAWPAINDPKEFYDLSSEIQRELIEVYNYQPLYSGQPRSELYEIEWEKLSTEDINEIYSNDILDIFKIFQSVYRSNV